MEKFNLYEYVAVIVPGVVFLFGLGVMLPEGHVFQNISAPDDMATAAVHLVLAFALGHMLQVVGQQLHTYYWADFGGFPTDWPFSREHKELSPALRQVVLEASGQTEAADLFQWRRAVATVRSLITTEGFAGRLETFHANYGMFRSMVVAGVLLMLLMPWWAEDVWSTSAVLAAGVVVSLLGMHRFGVHYARELFATASAWQQTQAAAAQRAAGTGPVHTRTAEEATGDADHTRNQEASPPDRPHTLKIVPGTSRTHKQAA